MVVIRFNPDSYINEDGEEIESPWKKTKLGVTLLESTESEWNKRTELLLERFNYWLENIPEKSVTIERLFFSKD